jgi:glycosyltransferase involved in cell wall biosynthesis
MKASIVIPTFNRRAILLRTLEKLFQQKMSASEYEIIVVVDGSTDGTTAALAELRPQCEFRVIEQENRGQATARNAGWRAARGELVIFLDDDMFCDPTLVQEHCLVHSRSGLALVGVGAIFLTDDSPRTLAAECFNREIGAFSRQYSRNPAMAVPRVFANTSLRRELLERTGGFDPRFRVREDAELSARLLSAGAAFEFIPAAIARQYYFKTNADLLRDAEQFAAADILLVREHPALKSTTLLGKLAAESNWRRAMRRVMLANSGIFEGLLGGVCAVSEKFRAKTLREVGVRALQARRVLRYSRKARELHD